MKVAKSSYATASMEHLKNVPILSLVPDDDVDDHEDKTKTASFKIPTVVGDNDSPKYSFTMTILDSSKNTRQAIQWYKNILRLFAGLSVNTAQAKVNLVKELTREAPASVFNSEMDNRQTLELNRLQQLAVAGEPARNAPAETEQAYQQRLAAARNGVDLATTYLDNDFHQSLLAMMASIVPYRALAKQKRFMRRHMRKPAGMRTRTYVNHLLRINNEELPYLPPFARNQGLSTDEIIDIVLYGVPKSWVNKMDEHDFDPLARTIGDLINFCERLEAAEHHEVSATTPKDHAKSKSSSKKFKPSGSGTKGKWCHYHETDTHNTSECETLKKLKAQKSGGSFSGPSKNKTWKRKSDDAKSYTKKELSAIGKKAAKKAIQQAKAECNAIAAKRKSDDDEMSVSSSSSDGTCNSAHMVEKMENIDKQLAGFEFPDDDKEVSC